ncbi:MAG: FAD-dependent oxidoreductase [Thermodesulfobacteriota bacterium]|nr:FAD-dependent oxidoreductase [Thermodesulfobacteriota bacterium]
MTIKYMKAGREAPCKPGCPIGIDIPRHLRYLSDGKFSEALAVMREKTPFPGILGHVCYQPCEPECRIYESTAPAVRVLHRFAFEQGRSLFEEKTEVKPSGKRAAVIGSGPAGLTAAYYLVKRGHRVTVFEALPEAGGMMRFKIPDYRLPRDVLDKELDAVVKIGVEIKTGFKAESLDDLFQEGYNAVFVAVGAYKRVEDTKIGAAQFGLPASKGSRLEVDPDTLTTKKAGVYAGGDCITGPRSVVEAIAAGRKAAVSIDKYLGGSGNIDERLAPLEEEFKPLTQGLPIGPPLSIPTQPIDEASKRSAEIELRYMAKLRSDRDVDEGLEIFSKKESSLRVEEAVEEAKRCLRCDLPIMVDGDQCIGCLICQLRCSLNLAGVFNPLLSALELTRREKGTFEIAFTDKCIDCGICARHCPYGGLSLGTK